MCVRPRRHGYTPLTGSRKLVARWMPGPRLTHIHRLRPNRWSLTNTARAPLPTPVMATRRKPMTDGITYNPGRQQPWTVWVRDEVVGFRATMDAAFRLFLQEQEK